MSEMPPANLPWMQPPAVVHDVDNLPVIPHGLPDSDSAKPKVALDEDQIAAIKSMAGDLMPTIKKWWAVFGVVATLAYGASKMDLSSFIDNRNRQPQPVVTQPDDSTKRVRDLEKSQADLLDIVQKQKQMLDLLSKK